MWPYMAIYVAIYGHILQQLFLTKHKLGSFLAGIVSDVYTSYIGKRSLSLLHQQCILLMITVSDHLFMFFYGHGHKG